VLLRTPPVDSIADLLATRDGIDPAVARAAASASQGHIGRAKRLATDVDAQERRRKILAIPLGVTTLGAALAAAQEIVEAAADRASQEADDKDESEVGRLKESWGVADGGRRPAGYAGTLSALEKDQKRRRTRLARDAIDGVLIDLLSFCRDVIAEQLAPGSDLVNADVAADVGRAAAAWTTTSTLRRIDAIVECRSQGGGARGSELRARLEKQGRRLPLLGSDDRTANREYVRHFLLDDYREYGKPYNLQWAERFYYVDDRPPARTKVDEYVEKNAVKI
jgi:DNA polymerase-3 subunit delta'